MKLLVMDHTGDSQQTFDVTKAAELEAAEKRFKELTGLGFTAAQKISPERADVVRTFDPTATELLFYPRLQGG